MASCLEAADIIETASGKRALHRDASVQRPSLTFIPTFAYNIDY
jgi:hypothetical protein